MHTDNSLRRLLKQIDKVFDINDIKKLQPDNAYIQRYYKLSSLGYTYFHDSADVVHMGISRSGVYHHDDLYEPERLIEKYITDKRARRVLELATGRGASCQYLSTRHPEVGFDGIELSPAHLKLARRKAKRLSNYRPVEGDYSDLSRYRDNSFDIVFVIEALCYSMDKSKVFAEVKRILKKEGVFIIVDGYRMRSASRMTADEQLACELTEKTMALNVFEEYRSVMDKARKLGYRKVYSENTSEATQPTLRRFESLARKFFKRPLRAKLLKFCLPRILVYNAVAGYLMPTVVKQGLLGHHIDVLQIN